MIDYVVPMVFPQDKSWRDGFRKVGRRYEACARYRSWGTERILVDLVRKNMPFANIIIILAQESQRQPWMDGLRVVYHHEFIPRKFLPTFSCRPIEMYLHRIPDLSDMFLYGNDDMFPLSPLGEDDFFVDGKPCINMMEFEYPKEPNGFQMACMNGMNFVASEFGLRFRRKWYKNGHSIAPILKSTCEHLWERGGSRIEASITPFRETKNFNQYIYSWWQYFSGVYVDHVPKITYTSVKKGVSEVLDDIKEGGIVCINDNECVDDIGAYAEAVRDALRRLA